MNGTQMMEQNPYLRLYRSYQIVVQGPPDKQIAEKISSSIAQLHNTMGHAINDLIRMMALQFTGKQVTEQRPTSQKAQSPISDKSGGASQVTATQNLVFSDPLLKKKLDLKFKPFQPFGSKNVLRISEKLEDIEDSGSEEKPVRSKPVLPAPSPRVHQPKASQKRVFGQLLQQQDSKHACSKQIKGKHEFKTSCNQCQQFYQLTDLDGSNSCQANSRHTVTAVPSKIPSFSQNFEI